MQHYPHDDPFEREPLDSSSSTNSSRRPRANPSSRRPIAATHDYSSPGPSSPYNSRSAAHTPYDNLNGNYYAPPPGDAPTPPRHGDNSYYSRGPPAHGEDMRYGESAPGAADRNMRDRGFETAYEGGSQLPPPPSRTASGHYVGGGGYMYDGYNSRGGNSPMRSQTSSIHNSSYPNDPYADDPYRAFSGSNHRVDRRLGEFNPNDIEDDGDDGLYYPRQSQRNSMLSSAATSDRGARPAVGAAAAVGGAAAAGGVMGGVLRRNRDQGPSYNLATGAEKDPKWDKKDTGDGMSKKMKIAIMVGVVLIIIGIVVGGVVGAMTSGRRSGGGGDSDRGESAEDDREKNGDLDINSDEIKELLNNPDLHRVFPGMDYTPIHAQYPDCLHHPPSQNNITRDMAVLSQLTNRVRLYGTDCNQTQMLIHAIDRLDLKGDVKIWLGVWQDDNSTTNARQLEQMWDVLDEYGDEPFEGLIVANEILFREEMTITELSDLLDDVRSNLTDMNLDLPVATSDLGDDWTSALGRASDYIMSNIHPFFAGVTAEEAADWTMSFWNNNNGDFFKSDDSKNIISETGWPTGGGTNCGGASSCSEGSVAGIDELNTFMEDFVCQGLTNGTNYFWFSAFDEPWKIAYNEDGKEWEDKWGLMDVNRNLKDGVKIPDCGGDTV